MADTFVCDRCNENDATWGCHGCCGFYCDRCINAHKHRGELETDYEFFRLDEPKGSVNDLLERLKRYITAARSPTDPSAIVVGTKGRFGDSLEFGTKVVERMAVKKVCHELCPRCGQVQYELLPDGRIATVHHKCSDPVPGPQSPPRALSPQDAVFVPRGKAVCPDCHGLTAITDLFGKSSPCGRCERTGMVPAEMPGWMAEGERMRVDRVDRGVGLREEAESRGMTARELCDMEMGRAKPMPPNASTRWSCARCNASGAVTYPKATDLQGIAKRVDDDHAAKSPDCPTRAMNSILIRMSRGE